MLHPSYTDLMAVVNSEVEPGEQPVVQSRYSIVMATSKRARQIIAGERALVNDDGKKPLSVAIDELYQSKVRIVGDEEDEMEEEPVKVPEVETMVIGKLEEIDDQPEESEEVADEETAVDKSIAAEDVEDTEETV